MKCIFRNSSFHFFFLQTGIYEFVVNEQMKIIPSKLEVAPHALKMSEWVSGVEWMDTP